MNKTRYAVAVAVLASAVALAQPASITFNGRLTDTTGQPLSGTHSLDFRLFAAATGGTASWTESYASTAFTADGLAFVELGSTTPLTTAVLDGSKLYLEIAVDGTTMSPRIGIVSVPYAIRAGAVGTLTEANIQRRVASTCATGNAIRVIAVDGTVTCEPVGGTAGGDITSVNTAGTSGLIGGVATGDANLSLMICPVGQVLKSASGTSASWGCQPDNAGGTYGTVANGGLVLNGTNFGLVTCTAGQVLKAGATAGTWACAADTNNVYTGTDFIVNGTAVQTASFNINGTAQIGTSQAIPTARLNVQGAANITGTGAVSCSATTSVCTGTLTNFTGEAAVYDIIVAAGQTRTIVAINAASGANAITVDAPWSADVLGAPYVLRRNVATFRTNAGNIAMRIDGNGGTTFSSLQRRIARAVVYGSDGTDVGTLGGRAVALAKVSNDSGVRVTWSDTFRVVGANACRWEVLFNGAACTSPGGLYMDWYSSVGDHHIRSTFVGTCFATAAGRLPNGNVTVSTQVYRSPGYTTSDCWTGWNNSYATIEAEEVY